jgi:hypothetical protein
MKFDKNFLSQYDLTIIVTEELHAEIRGYALKNREFKLKHPDPQKRQAETLDGCIVEDDYYVVSAAEYERVTGKNLKGEDVLIPTWAGKVSFRPKYLNIGK